MLMEVLPRCPPQYRKPGSRQEVPPSTTRKRKRDVFDKEQLAGLKELYQELNRPVQSQTDPEVASERNDDLTAKDAEMQTSNQKLNKQDNVISALLHSKDSKELQEVQKLADEKKQNLFLDLSTEADQCAMEESFADIVTSDDADEILKLSEQEGLETAANISADQKGKYHFAVDTASAVILFGQFVLVQGSQPVYQRGN